MAEVQVLVVEDELIVAEDIRNKLERLGYGVPAVVGSGMEAIRAAEELRPDLVLVDIGLPGDLDGVAAAGEIHGRLDIPVVYLTAHSDERTLAWARNTAPFGYILKPFDARELRSTLEMALYRHEQEQRVRESEARYRDLYENALNAYFSVGTDGFIRQCNRQASLVLGYPKEALIGRSIFDLYADTPQGKEKAQAIFQRLAVGEEVRDQELQMQRADETLLWISLTIKPVRDASGQVVESHSEVVDITARKQAEETLIQRAAQLALLNDIGGQVAATLHLDSVLTQAVRLVQQSFGYHHVALFTLDRQGRDLVMRARAGGFAHLFPSEHRLALGQGVVGWVGANGETLLANDVDAEPRYVNLYPDVLPTRSELSVPIQVAGRVLGVIDVQSPQPDAFDDNDVLVMQTLADQIAVAIENARLYEAAQRELTERKQAERALQELNLTLEDRVRQRTFELQVLHELTQEIGYTLNYDDLFRLILQHLHRVCEYDIAASLLVSENHWQVFIRQTRPTGPEVQAEVQEQLLGTYERLAAARRPETGIALRSHHAEQYDPALPALHNPKSHVQVPIFAAGKVLGIVYVGSEREQEFGGDVMRVLYTLSSQAADSIQRLRALLAEEQQRLESLVENLPEGILLLDAAHRVLLTNPIAVELLSALNGAGVGDVLTHLGSVSLDQVLREARGAVPRTITVETPAFRAFEVSVQAMSSGPSAEERVIVVLRDVTEMQKIDQQMHQQQRLAAVGQLAGGIAHDFNNILTAIILYSQVSLRKKDELPPRVTQGLEIILESGRRAADLVRQILDFSRHAEMETHPVDLRTFVQGVMAVLERTLPESISIVLDKGVDECIVQADPTRIQQVLLNLAVNARDAMPEGGDLSVILSTNRVRTGEEPPVVEMPAGDWVCLSVADTGTGMPPEVAAHIFEPFFTTKPRGQGTGLGLAQVYGIVKQHEGFIGVETEPGRGTTIRIYLPADRTGEEDDVLGGEQAGSLEALRGQAETILLVEDEEVLRAMGREILESLNYRVLTAADGQEALDVFYSADGIDLVITDMVMPLMGGRALVQALQKGAPNLKALALTGYAVVEDLQELRAAGILDVVEKPFDERTLARAVHRALNVIR